MGEVSMYFSDIQSFTTIVESLPPESSLLLLSRYFHDMSKTIDEYGGIVLEFIGDAISSIYGAPVKNDDHAASAVKAALRMLDQLDAMNKWFAQRSLPHVAIRCGVHTGTVLVGNMGFQSRVKYGVVGEESEIPGRLEEMNKNYTTKMLISHATFLKLTPGSFILRPIDFINLGTVDNNEVQPVYQVIDRDRGGAKPSQVKTAFTIHTEAMEAYRSRDFQAAHKKFKHVNNILQDMHGEEDCPSEIFMRRSNFYLENPPPPGWDGVWDPENDKK